MGTLVGHVLPGVGFLLLGMWQLYNTMLNYVKAPWDFKTRAWFPLQDDHHQHQHQHQHSHQNVNSNKTKPRFSMSRHGELVFIMVGSLASISAELFIGPTKHQPLDSDGTIPSYHLQNFEHATVSLSFLVYAVVAVALDLRRGSAVPAPRGAAHAASAVALAVEWLLFHDHSADHMGIEGHFHALLQLLVLATLAGTVAEIVAPTSLFAACVRCMGLLFQGVWFIHMGLELWIPGLVPKGCRIRRIHGHDRVFCVDAAALARAKAIANLCFCWYIVALLLAAVAGFFWLAGRFGPGGVYVLADDDLESGGENEAMMKSGNDKRTWRASDDGSQSSLELESMRPVDLQR